ncbi:hypothetical protein TSOC_002390 [Tetrabaena socialis]|uniref:Uncharacterized protein n=1 Tax=Tetrabaena socialis TaxID=47790 RepID=A0A2J8AEC0_9CHLO|nr:hypothetical protein TSOC_002390 [Tetrabaena socialis]|eukprot:PNH10871.1 hypothetical protein TSOC_002390 [Tetrabaena socialis]
MEMEDARRPRPVASRLRGAAYLLDYAPIGPQHDVRQQLSVERGRAIVRIANVRNHATERFTCGWPTYAINRHILAPPR